MFVLRFDVESAYALHPSLESDGNWQIWLEETLASVEQRQPNEDIKRLRSETL